MGILRGVDGRFYEVPDEDMEKFLVPDDKVKDLLREDVTAEPGPGGGGGGGRGPGGSGPQAIPGTGGQVVINVFTSPPGDSMGGGGMSQPPPQQAGGGDSDDPEVTAQQCWRNCRWRNCRWRNCTWRNCRWRNCF